MKIVQNTILNLKFYMNIMLIYWVSGKVNVYSTRAITKQYPLRVGFNLYHACMAMNCDWKLGRVYCVGVDTRQTRH